MTIPAWAVYVCAPFVVLGGYVGVVIACIAWFEARELARAALGTAKERG